MDKDVLAVDLPSQFKFAEPKRPQRSVPSQLFIASSRSTQNPETSGYREYSFSGLERHLGLKGNRALVLLHYSRSLRR